MQIVAVIPARLESSRFPGKLLAAETGHPLIEHVYRRATRATSIDRVVVAGDDERIAAAVRAFGGIYVETRRDHENGTTRIAEAVATLDADLVVNVQGDEPEIEPAAIDAAVAALRADERASVGTLAAPIAPGDPALTDPNVVKVVLDRRGRALYFSRAPIPWDRDAGGPGVALRHVGLYVYRRAFLVDYAAWPSTPLERSERLEQLRVLENGHAISVAVVETAGEGIDTPEQYAAFVRRWRDRERNSDSVR